jgi:raffinose/stachyose/melibiose transport system substrate-binding protein
MKRIFMVLGIAILFSGMVWASGSAEGSATGSTVKNVKLDIMLTNYGRFKAQFDQYLGQFVKKELADKNINVTYNLELPSDPNLIKTRLATGEAPDIYSLHAAFDAPTFAKGGYLPDLTNQPFVAKLYPNVREIVTIDGKVFGVPLESFTWSYLYNKGIFDKYGLKPPSTISEMKQVIAALKRNGVVPFMLPYKDAYFAGWLSQIAFCTIAPKQVPDWWDRMNKGQASLGELRDRGMFNIIDLVNQNGTPNALEIGADDGVAMFAKGDAAMMVTGPWYADGILKVNPNFKLGLAGLPVNDDPTNTMVMLAVSTAVTVYPNGPNEAVGVDFLNYLLYEPDSSAFFKSLKFNQLATDQSIPTFPWTAEGLVYVQKGLTYRDRAIPNSPNDVLGKMSQLYYAHQVTQQQFVDAVDQAWKKSISLGQ